MKKDTPIIEFSEVTFSFSDTKVLFENLSLKLNAGNFYLIQGPSGSGKSTFLRLVNRLEEASQGTVLFNGKPLASYNPPCAAAIDPVYSTDTHRPGWDGSAKPAAILYL